MSEPTWQDAIQYAREIIETDRLPEVDGRDSPRDGALLMKMRCLARLDEVEIVMRGRTADSGEDS